MAKIYVQNRIDWDSIPISTSDEVRAPSAKTVFVAETTLQEKVTRVFNATMFAVVALKCFIPLIPLSASAAIGGYAFVLTATSTIFQLPAAMSIMVIAPKIITAVALVVVVRKVLAIIINHFVYQAVRESYTNRYDEERVGELNDLTSKNYEFRRLSLRKSGYRYDAFAVGHKDTISNGKWALIAGGNRQIAEDVLTIRAEEFKKRGLNILFVNGPGVARSNGFPTSYSMSAGQEAGMQFLEKVVQAKKIIPYGISLGGATQLEAAFSHQFINKEKYLFWSDRTFSKLSDTASAMVTRFAKPLFFLLGNELNALNGARKLEEMNIPHIVTQRFPISNMNTLLLPHEGVIYKQGTDGILPNSISLYVGMRTWKIGGSTRVKYYGHDSVDHNGPLSPNIRELVDQDIKDFLKD